MGLFCPRACAAVCQICRQGSGCFAPKPKLGATMTIRQRLRLSTSLLMTASVSATVATLVAHRAGLVQLAQAQQQTDEQKKDKGQPKKGPPPKAAPPGPPPKAPPPPPPKG